MKALAAGLLLVLASAAAAHDRGRTDNGAAERPFSRGIGRWEPLIKEASGRFAIPEEWIRRVMRAESGGRTTLDGRPITSRAGAMGLMQLMPGTWADMRVKHKLGPDPHAPRDNILAGTAYLRAMYERFGYPGLFAAYNAGPARYARHLATGRPLPAETVAYVGSVAGVPARAAAPPEQDRDNGLFVRLAKLKERDRATVPSAPARSSLFVQLGTASRIPE